MSIRIVHPNLLRRALTWLALRLLPIGVHVKGVTITISRIEVL
jgi:hypothetical protein